VTLPNFSTPSFLSSSHKDDHAALCLLL
jgi:hypothetical protein